MGIFILVIWLGTAVGYSLAIGLVVGIVLSTDYLTKEYWHGWGWIGMAVCLVLTAVGIGWLRALRRMLAASFSAPVYSSDPQASFLAGCIKWPALVGAVVFILYAVGATIYLLARALA
jgi:hypothetical protein